MPSMREFTESLIKKHNPTVLAEIYQGASEKMKSAAKHSEEFPDCMSGVCQAIAAEWIKFNKIGEAGVVRDMYNKKINDHFFNCQQTISSTKQQLKTLNSLGLAEIEQFQKKYKEIKDPSLLSKILNTIPEESEVKQLGESAKKKIEEAQQQSKELYESFGGPNTTMNKVVTMGDCGKLPLQLQSDLQHAPAYYLLNLNASGSGGHSIGFHSATSPRCIDANSCEFLFASMQLMHNFLAEYWKPYTSMYSGGTYDLFRYT